MNGVFVGRSFHINIVIQFAVEQSPDGVEREPSASTFEGIGDYPSQRRHAPLSLEMDDCITSLEEFFHSIGATGAGGEVVQVPNAVPLEWSGGSARRHQGDRDVMGRVTSYEGSHVHGVTARQQTGAAS